MAAAYLSLRNQGVHIVRVRVVRWLDLPFFQSSKEFLAGIRYLLIKIYAGKICFSLINTIYSIIARVDAGEKRDMRSLRLQHRLENVTSGICASSRAFVYLEPYQ